MKEFEKELEIVVPNAAELAAHDKEAFAKIRRAGLGASDSSIILGVNHWTTPEQLMEQKCSDTLTEDEIAVGEKPQVRMGADLEPIILQKFIDRFNVAVYKPDPMYRLVQYPWLTVNFDGILGETTPVECKLISTFADRYWGKNKALAEGEFIGKRIPMFGSATSISNHIEVMSNLYGIPPYYYTQVQQQMLAANAASTYLAAMFLKDWTLRVYQIYRDQITIDALISRSKTIWDCIEMKKGGR